MEIIIRNELESDYWDTEYMTKKAFWNLHVPGCNEHLLVHKIREHKDYVPALSRVATIDGKVVGTIMYTKSRVVKGEEGHEVLTFGPLCVEPSLQNEGIGGRLLKETMELAREAGYKGIIIFGEPGYYPRFGFKTCDNFNITTAEGKNFDAFMAIELIENGLKDVEGKFYASEVFNDPSEEELEGFDKNYPFMEKLRLPGQWGYSEEE